MSDNTITDSMIEGVKTIRIPSEKPNFVVFRCAISNKEEANTWLSHYKRLTKTEWIVEQPYSKAVRLEYHKKYKCAFSSKNKTLAEGQGGNRNYNCKMTLNIRIKLLTKDTVKKDKYLKEDPPLRGIITVEGEHSHNNECCSIMNYFRPGKELRETFEEYFQTMTPTVALNHHDALLRTRENGAELLGNGHYSPLPYTVHYWYNAWRVVNYGPLKSPLVALEEKVELYRKIGVTVKVRQESPWAVLVATPVMKRVHETFFTKNIIFVDTSASCDSTSCNVTLMLTATKAGAVPIAVLLHEAQTTHSYEIAFSLFKSTFPEAFGGRTHPTVFVTDNSQAEKNALKTVWPESNQLLCGFHVGQAEWQWLHSNAEASSKKPLMKAFQKIQYAVCTEQLNDAVEELKTLSPDYYEKRVAGLLEQKEEWVRLFQAELPTGGNATNNYAEASVRILKDVILQRIKAYNPAALVDYIGQGWETYLQTKLLRYAYKKIKKAELLYQDLIQKMSPELADKIIQVDDDTYHVPSAKSGEPAYEVVASTGVCLCPAGTTGAFCKHQALVHQKFGKMFPNQPLITSADRYLIGKLALGSKCPEKTFFLEPKESLLNLERDLEELERLYSVPCSSLALDHAEVLEMNDEVLPRSPSPEPEDEEDQEEIFKKFCDSWGCVLKKGTETNRKGFLKFMRRATTGLNNISNQNTAFEVMMKLSTVVNKNKAISGKKIRTQPAAAQRRRAGLTKGASRVPSGRPANCEPSKSHKRPRRLGASIAANKPHYKKH